MDLRPVLLALLFLPAVAAVGMPAHLPQSDWHIVTEDPALDAGLELTADITQVSLLEESDQLHFDVDGTVDLTEVRLHIVFAHQGTPYALVAHADGVDIYRSGTLSDTVTYGGDGPGGFPFGLPKARLFGGMVTGEMSQLAAYTTKDVTEAQYAEPTIIDRAPDTGYGEPYTLHEIPQALRSQDADALPWTVMEGPDYAGAPSVVVQDGIHIAFQIYDSGREYPAGLYYATVDDELEFTRIAPSHERYEDCRDTCGRTAIAVDETVHILYEPDPRSDQGYRHVMRQGAEWVISDPLDGLEVQAEQGWSAVADIVADGHVVAALPVNGQDIVLLEYDAGWSLIRTIHDARYPDLDIDSQGRLHVAWMRYTDADRERGDLHYMGPDGEAVIASGIQARNGFWETKETDGTWDFALTPDDVPAFVYELPRDERHYAELDDGLRAWPTPLEPTHGNPQLRLLMAFDGMGRPHFAGGYGGIDLYAVRNDAGGWWMQDMDRVDSFDMAVHPDGRAVIVGTGPHGGTTLEVWQMTDAASVDGVEGGLVLLSPDPDAQPVRDFYVPGLGAGTLVALWLGRKVKGSI